MLFAQCPPLAWYHFFAYDGLDAILKLDFHLASMQQQGMPAFLSQLSTSHA
jgi:hypothetical protein